MDILILMLLFQIKHWYADFMIQTYEQTVKKGIYFDYVGMSHSLDHMYGTLIALLIFNIFVPLSIISVIVVTILEGLAHYHIDWFKVKFGSKDLTKPLFWNQFGMDQMAHQLTYLIAVWYLLIFK